MLLFCIIINKNTIVCSFLKPLFTDFSLLLTESSWRSFITVVLWHTGSLNYTYFPFLNSSQANYIHTRASLTKQNLRQGRKALSEVDHLQSSKIDFFSWPRKIGNEIFWVHNLNLYP